MANRLVSVDDNLDFPKGVADRQAEVIADSATTTDSPLGLVLSTSYPSTVSIAGDSIDPTGTANSTAAIQAKLNEAANSHAYLPAGNYKVAGTLTVSGERTRFYGPGVLVWDAGIENAPALLVTGKGSIIDGLKLLNPRELGSKTGSSTAGIRIQAHDVSVVNCLVDSFQSGVWLAQNGEWANIVIANNRIKDVLGSGAGPNDATSDRGEDRGDGIFAAGASVSITGNVINAKSGRDARIGIHCEALTDQQQTHPIGENRSFTVTGNIITGPFRRSIATEDVSNATIAGNACADATWWGISISGSPLLGEAQTGRGITVTGNTMTWTKPAGQTPGMSWGPKICCIQVLNAVKGAIINGNTIIIAGTSKSAVLIDGSAAMGFPDDIIITGNVFKTTNAGSYELGVAATERGTGNIKISGNIFKGFTGACINVDGVADFSITDNTLDGIAATGVGHRGVQAAGPTKGGTISGNQINNVSTGVEHPNALGGTIIAGNVFRSVTKAIDLYGTSNCSITGNAFIGTTTAIANTNATNVATGNVTVA